MLLCLYYVRIVLIVNALNNFSYVLCNYSIKRIYYKQKRFKREYLIRFKEITFMNYWEKTTAITIMMIVIIIITIILIIIIIIIIIIKIIVIVIIIIIIINKRDKWSIKTTILNFWTRFFMDHHSQFQVLFEHWQITNSNKIMSLKRLLSCVIESQLYLKAIVK